MQLAHKKIGPGLAFTLFLASTLGLLSSSTVCLAHSIGGGHAGHVGHIGHAAHVSHIAPHHNIGGTHLNSMHGEHFDRGHEGNLRHNDMSRRDNWNGRNDHNFDRGHEGNMRHEEMSRHDEHDRAFRHDEHNRFRDHDREFRHDDHDRFHDRDHDIRHDDHQRHYLGRGADHRMNNGVGIRRPNEHDGNKNAPMPLNKDNAPHSGSYFKLDKP